jgi:hypothetical protein
MRKAEPDVRDEALGAVLDRATERIDAMPGNRLPEVLRRGSQRRTARFTAVVAAVAVFAGAVGWAGLSLPVEEVEIPANVSESRTTITFHDEQRGYTVTYPDDWVVARENLTPWLSSPSEILSLGTFPLRVSRDPEDGLRIWDAPVAPAALADMTAADAFVSLQEDPGGFDRVDEPRPESFGPRGCQDSILGCGPRDVPFQGWWIPFEDEGRGFYLSVVIGDDVTAELRQAAWDVADSLSFEPRS